jgi:hypothetical protein
LPTVSPLPVTAQVMKTELMGFPFDQDFDGWGHGGWGHGGPSVK